MSIQTLYASASRTDTPTAVVVNTRRAVALDLVVDVTTFTATPSVVATVDGFDSLSGKYFNLLTSAAMTNTTTRVLHVGPGLTASASTSSAFVPDQVRVLLTHGDNDAVTYSASLHLLK